MSARRLAQRVLGGTRDSPLPEVSDAALFLLALALSSGCKKHLGDDGPRPYDAPTLADAPKAAPVTPVQQMARNFERVHFDTDSAALTGATIAALNENVSIMQAHSDLRLEVQGHCDERATTDYNLALGQQRASAVQTFMANAGVAKSRVTTLSLGEERPLDRQGGDIAWAQNRRAEFRISPGSTRRSGWISTRPCTHDGSCRYT